MKKLLVIVVVAALAAISWSCKCSKKATKSAAGSTVYRGKLETKALCMNYTLRLIQGSIDTSLIVPEWTDPGTGKSFQNAFGLANPCDFPDNIQQGDEFSFTIDTGSTKQCAVCMAYYPTPERKLNIKVLGK